MLSDLIRIKKQFDKGVLTEEEACNKAISTIYQEKHELTPDQIRLLEQEQEARMQKNHHLARLIQYANDLNEIHATLFISIYQQYEKEASCPKPTDVESATQVI